MEQGLLEPEIVEIDVTLTRDIDKSSVKLQGHLSPPGRSFSGPSW